LATTLAKGRSKNCRLHIGILADKLQDTLQTPQAALTATQQYGRNFRFVVLLNCFLEFGQHCPNELHNRNHKRTIRAGAQVKGAHLHETKNDSPTPSLELLPREVPLGNCKRHYHITHGSDEVACPIKTKQ
jgi:hypothetical protein